MSDMLDMHALADGELKGDAKAQAEAKLSDAAHKAEFESVQALKGVLQKVESVSCEKTWSECRGRLAELDKRRTVENVVGRYSWGLCAIFFAVIMGAGLFNRAFDTGGIGTGEAARAFSGLAPSSTAVHEPIPMTDWIKAKPQKQIRLVGRALGNFQGHPVFRYDLEDPEGKLAILGIKGVSSVEGVEPMLDNQEYAVGKINGTNCVTWSEHDATMFLVADRPFEKLAEVATELRQE